MFGVSYESCRHGDDGTKNTRTAGGDVGGSQRAAVVGESPVLREAKSAVGRAGVRRVVEAQCRPFYAEKMGRPSLAPGQYFRLLLLGYVEGLDSERGMAWRAADSSGVRGFLGLALTEAAPDHSTISGTRRFIDLDTHREVFTWVV